MRLPNTHSIWKESLQKDLLHLARHYDTRKSKFEYEGGKEKFGQKIHFHPPYSLKNLLTSIAHQPKLFLSKFTHRMTSHLL